MRYESPLAESPGTLKIEYARTLVATLSYLILKQFDAVGLTLFNNRVIQKIPPRSKPSHFQHIIHGLEAFDPSGTTNIGQVIADITERLPSRSMVLLISDLLNSDEDLYKNINLLCSRACV